MSTKQSIIDTCESPIEVMMLKALAFAPWPGVETSTSEDASEFIQISKLAASVFAGLLYSIDHRIDCLKPAVSITTQANIGRYRADILVEHTPNILHGRTAKIVVECDGKEFHTDREAKINDAKRTRFMMDAGYWVTRFSGSDIYRNPSACALDVVKCAMSLHTDDRRYG